MLSLRKASQALTMNKTESLLKLRKIGIPLFCNPSAHNYSSFTSLVRPDLYNELTGLQWTGANSCHTDILD